MSNPKIAYWKQRADIYLWRFRDKVRNFPGLNLTADSDGCASLTELLTIMADDERSSTSELFVTAPPTELQELAGIGRGNCLVPDRLVLKYPPSKVAADCWRWTGDLCKPTLTLGRTKLSELLAAVQSVAKGTGDFCVSAKHQKCHGLDFERMAVWFW